MKAAEQEEGVQVKNAAWPVFQIRQRHWEQVQHTH